MSRLHFSFLKKYSLCLVTLVSCENSEISKFLIFLDADSLLHRMILIGTLLQFRSLCQEPLNDVSFRNLFIQEDCLSIPCCTCHFQAVKQHVPHLYSCVEDFGSFNQTGDAMMVSGYRDPFEFCGLQIQ